MIYFLEILSQSQSFDKISFYSVCSLVGLVHFFRFQRTDRQCFCRCCFFFHVCEKFHAQIFSGLSLKRASVRARGYKRVIAIAYDYSHTNTSNITQKQFLLSKKALRISPKINEEKKTE